MHRRKYPEIEVGDTVRSFRKKKAGEKERLGNFEDGTKKVRQISKSLGQTFYKLDAEEILYTRADIHLITKAKEGEKERETVTPALNATRNLSVADEDRTLEQEEVS